MHQKPFDRHDRVKSLITEIVASFIRDEANPEPLITLTRLDISPDYRKATVAITTIPEGGEQDALIFLKRKGSEIRKRVMKQSNLKIVPHIDFEIDYGERHRQHIDDLLRQEGEI
ncbi:ribosome-binding factor A [Candidatus Kaiserbacteria bacterium]|nr:ribosome-binding factor A [Candidatus Kaiserbacteria bacterium]